MMRGKLVRVLAVFCAAALMVGALAGCATTPNNAQDEAQTANRQYMASASQSMDELSSRLQDFEDAVSRGDVVAMQTQADNAFKAIDEFAAVEAPEALGEVRQGYIDGCAALKEALSAYIALYTEIDSATAEHPFDYATYDERLASIQEQYDNGVSQLEAADKKAAEL